MIKLPQTVALREVAKIERQIIDPGEIDDGTLYVGLENIEPGGQFTDVRAVHAGELASSKFSFTSDHLLYGKLRPYLAKIARPNFEGVCSTDILPVLPGPNLDRGFLAWLLLSPKMLALASSRASGANLPRLSPDTLAEFEIPLPPLSEQRRIADILDKADALRAKRRAALAQHDTLAQSIFLDMFGNPATNPMQWPEKNLSELTTEVYRYPTYYDIAYVEDGVPEIRGELLNPDGTIANDRNRLRFVAESTSERFPKTVLATGDLVMSVRGTIGKVGLVSPDLAGANITANLMRIALDQEQVDPLFVWYSMQTLNFKRQLANACSSTTILTIKAPELKKLQLFVPPIGLQREFTNQIGTQNRSKKIYLKSLEGLDALFAALEHHAFQGEL